MSFHDESLKLALGLDSLTGTFKRDQEFCEAVAKVQPGNIARLLVYCRWSRIYLPQVQIKLNELVPRHFGSANASIAGFWTASLIGGLIRDLGVIPYLALRGLIWEAGTGARRGLENVGLLAHLWREPSKASFLEDPDSKNFRDAFVNESDKFAAKKLKERCVQKRFAANDMDIALSSLYRMLSSYSVHGATPNQLVKATIDPTKLSCLFVNRPDPTVTPVGSDLEIFVNASEMLCYEVAVVFGVAAKTYKLPWSDAHEGGNLLSKLMSREDPISQKFMKESLRDLGWGIETQ